MMDVDGDLQLHVPLGLFCLGIFLGIVYLLHKTDMHHKMEQKQ